MPPNAQTAPDSRRLNVAIIGQSQFAADVALEVIQRGHHVVVVFTVEDTNGRPDALAQMAGRLNVPVHKVKRWRIKGKPIPEVLTLYRSYEVDLNLLPYCSQFIPIEVINAPKFQTICYHPSLLPRHRGASAIHWTLISGDPSAGFSIFWADDGLDTGPILLQRTCQVADDDTVDTIYKRFLYPMGVQACGLAIDMVTQNTAPRIIQDESKASYEMMLTSPQSVDWSLPTQIVHNFIRGHDSVPGAVCRMHLDDFDGYEEVLLYGSTICDHTTCKLLEEINLHDPEECRKVDLQGSPNAWLTNDGLMVQCGDGGLVNIQRLKLQGRVRMAKDLLVPRDQHTLLDLVLDDSEIQMRVALQRIWSSILGLSEIDANTDFFTSGASSMDVVRLIEEVREDLEVQDLENESVFLHSGFEEFFTMVVQLKRSTNGGQNGDNVEVPYQGVVLHANNMSIRCPTQLFINGQFTAAAGGHTLDVVNPHSEDVLCQVQCASEEDVDRAVKAAKKAFECGEWTKISARDRGRLLLRLAELMEAHKEELATIESLDSGAVYTLALKTHVGMSIQTWRYYGGWCDKIEGATIPISNARPNRNFTFTKIEPIGVCGLITPWNYPLMMLSWKMAACLAAGNTCIIKPAQVTPLTALKFAELSVLAGIPPGVINVLPGTGAGAGAALTQHPDIRKLGFTGSTAVGRTIMASCASSLKKVSLELGGKSPLVVFADCDLEKAVRVGAQSVFFNKGENCIAAGRIFVEAAIHDEFVVKVMAETRKLVVGDPLERSTTHGPQNHLAHLRKLLEYVRRGVQEGAVLQMGGRRVDRPGYYFEPTIFTNVQDHMFVAREESFGPIMVISKFKNGDLDGVLRRANNNEYGLAAGVFTSDLSKAMRFSEAVHAGTVFVNTYNKTDVGAPFGGVKQSGFGKDLGRKALDEYLITKTVTMEY